MGAKAFRDIQGVRDIDLDIDCSWIFNFEP